ncbi:MAG: YfhO family protein, partial [Gemmatimonadota bacterium]|nr:YfhO family protein [Gemmatimonadota bacterium]
PAALLRFARITWFEPGWPQIPQPVLEAELRTGGLIVLTGFGMAWGLGWLVARRRVAPAAVVALLLFTMGDLWRIGGRYLRVEEGPVWTADPIVERLERDVRPGERIWGAEGTYGANDLMYWGLSSPVGMQKFQLEPYARLVGTVRSEEGFLRNPTLMPFFHIAYLVTASPQPRLTPLLEAGGRRLYAIPSPPHAFFPAEVRGVRTASEAVEATRGNPDPLALAVVETPAGTDPPRAGAGTAAVIGYESEMVELAVEAERAGLRAVSEIYHPGWTAYLDDIETPIWKTNAAFRGLEIPEGRHTVRFIYRSPAFEAGIWLGAVGWLVLLGAVVLSWRSARRRAGWEAEDPDA